MRVPSSAELIAEIAREFPRFRLVPKRESPLSRLIDIALRIVTLGAQSQFLTHYHTVLGYRLYTPDTWATAAEVDRVIVLRHERVHLRQRRRYGFLLMAFLYLIPFFPLGLAYGRARIEWEAYVETIRATAELKSLDDAKRLRDHVVARFVSADYGWMWPFRRTVESWFDEVIADLAAERASE